MERQAKYHEKFPDYNRYFKKSYKKVEEYLKTHKNKYQFGDIIYLEDGIGDDGFQIVMLDGKYRSCSYDGMDSILYPIELKHADFTEPEFNQLELQGVKYDTILKELEKDELWNPLISKNITLEFYDKELNTYEEIVEIYRNNGLLSENNV
jgi:hypothetical protein